LDFYSSYFKLNDELQWLNLLLLLAHHPSNFRNKNGIKWEKFPSGQTSPSIGTPMSQFSLRFILRFRALGAFLVFTKMLTFCGTGV